MATTKINKGRKTTILLECNASCILDWVALTNVMSARVKFGNAEIKKGLLFFLAALSFGFKWSVKWKLVKATGTAQRNKANDCSLTA